MFQSWEDETTKEIPDKHKSAEPVNLSAVLLYLLDHGTFSIHHKNDKANFRFAYIAFYVSHDILYHKKTFCPCNIQRQRTKELKMIHEGSCFEFDEAVAFLAIMVGMQHFIF